MILTDVMTGVIDRARRLVADCRGRDLQDVWRRILGLHDGHTWGASEKHVMQVARDFAEAIVELADGTSVARAPTDHALVAITKARNLALLFPPGAFVSIDDGRAFAEALVELAAARPNKIDAARVERGDWDRAAGDAECLICGEPLYDHPVVPGIEWLRRHCDGRLVKL